jgi:hypothetical protein
MGHSLGARLAVVLLLAASAAATSACATSINKVLADPSRYRNEEVTVSGTVLDSYSIGSRGAYRISDRNAELWVVSERGVPRKGARVKVTGTIREGFNVGILGDRVKLPVGLGSGLVLVEREHKASY